MHLCFFGLFKKRHNSGQDDSCRSRLANMKAQAATKEEQPANNGVMDRMRDPSGADQQLARRRIAMGFWFMPESETGSRLRRSLSSGALAHLETTFTGGARNE